VMYWWCVVVVRRESMHAILPIRITRLLQQ
jgi:hypothetical protein